MLKKSNRFSDKTYETDTGYIPEASASSDEGIEVQADALNGVIDHRTVGGAEVFVFIPEGIRNRRITAPIILVYADKAFTAETAAETALTCGFAAIAKEEDACVAFVCPKSENWGKDDLEVYLAIVDDLYIERPDDSWKDGKTSGGQYQGYAHRIYVIAERSGADFASEYLADDYLYNRMTYGTAQRIPASFILFNSRAAPGENATETRGYPVAVINGSEEARAGYAAINYDKTRVLFLESDVSEGFDAEIIAEVYAAVTGCVRRQQLNTYDERDDTKNNIALFDIPYYANTAITVCEKTVILSDGNEVAYLEYTPASLDMNANKSIPLVLAFHGMGERAEYFMMLSGWPELGEEYSFMTVAIDDHLSVDADKIPEFLDLLIERFPCIDASRVYITGFSMGADKTLQLALSFPERFAAAAPMDGCFSDFSALSGYSIPVYYVCGQEDPYPVFPRSYSDRVSRMLGHLFSINGIGEYKYDSSADEWWGFAPHSRNSFKTKNTRSVVTENCYVNAAEEPVLMLVKVSLLSHNVCADNSRYVWEYMRQFSRAPDGTVYYTENPHN